MNNILLRIDGYAWDRFLAAPINSIREGFWDRVGIAVADLRGFLGYL